MKKHIAVLALAGLMLTGCGAEAPVETTPATAPVVSVIPMETLPPVIEGTAIPETEVPETEVLQEEPVPLAPEAYQVTYSYLMDGSQEFYTFQGIDPDKNIAWSLETTHLDCAQISRVSPIGTMDEKFYYCEDGSVIALDVMTGEQLWVNKDFGGSIATEACVILDPAGFLCLSGYFGPDLFVLDTEGNTIQKMEHFDPSYYWASRIWQESGQLFVHLDGGAPEGKDFSMTMDWIPQAQG